MAATNPNRCSLCYADLTNTDTEQITLTTRTLSLCPTCSNQAEQIARSTGSTKQAAVAYMVDLIWAALTNRSEYRPKKTSVPVKPTRSP